MSLRTGLSTRLREQRDRGTAGTLCVRMVSVALAFASMLVLGRTLGSTGYGIFAGTMSIANFGAYLARVSVEAMQMRTIAAHTARQEFDLAHGALRFGGLVTLALSAAPIAVLGILIWQWPQVLGPFHHTALLGAALIMPMALAAYTQGALRGLSRYVIAFVPSYILVHAFHLAIVAGLLLFATVTPTGALLGMNVAWYFAAVIALILLKRAIPATMRKAAPAYRQRAWLHTSAFTALGMVNVIFIGQADVFLIGLLSTVSEAGVYAAGQRIAWLLMIPVMAVYGGLSPTIAALHAAGDTAILAQRVRTGARETVILALAIGIPLTLLAPAIFALLGAEFAPSREIYLILAAGLILAFLCGRAFETLIMTGHAALAGCVSFSAIAFNAVADIAVIPQHGALGAATVTAVILPIESAVLTLFAWRRLRIRCDIIGDGHGG